MLKFGIVTCRILKKFQKGGKLHSPAEPVTRSLSCSVQVHTGFILPLNRHNLDHNLTLTSLFCQMTTKNKSWCFFFQKGLGRRTYLFYCNQPPEGAQEAFASPLRSSYQPCLYSVFITADSYSAKLNY